jgi:hypothetical protein
VTDATTTEAAPVAEAPAADVPVTVTEVLELVDTDDDGLADTVVETVVIEGDWGAEDAWAGDSDVPADDDDDARE